MRDVGSLPHLQPAQDVSLHSLQEVRVRLTRLGVLRLRDTAGRAGVPGCRVRLRLGRGRRGAADGKYASHAECQSKKTATHFLMSKKEE